MQGEYRGDFSRDTFNAKAHYSRVLMQQGRVLLDADWNEQTAILLHYLRSLAIDMFGQYGGPDFVIGPQLSGTTLDDLTISLGHYYVDGLLCENEGELGSDGKVVVSTYYKQPDYYPSDEKEGEKLPTQLPFLVYLDVWERHLTYVESSTAPFTLNTPNMREVALGKPDTATRARVVWQVKVQPLVTSDELKALFEKARWTTDDNRKFESIYWPSWKAAWQAPNRGMLKAQAKITPGETSEPCLASPEARYRGLENQLYRIEVHRGGVAWNGNQPNQGGNQAEAATFKWSRNNGAQIFPVRELAGTTVTLEHLGYDSASSLIEDDWVELIDDDMMQRGQPGVLAQISAVQSEDMQVTLKLPAKTTLPGYVAADYSAKHVLLRRWDHKTNDKGSTATQGGELPKPAPDGALLIAEGQERWLALEDGVQISFQAATSPAHQYRTGDYWLIPARVVTGDVEWRRDKNLEPLPQPPHGVEHHYAPLAIVGEVGGKVEVRYQWRR